MSYQVHTPEPGQSRLLDTALNRVKVKVKVYQTVTASEYDLTVATVTNYSHMHISNCHIWMSNREPEQKHNKMHLRINAIENGHEYHGQNTEQTNPPKIIIIIIYSRRECTTYIRTVIYVHSKKKIGIMRMRITP